ncbi:hypothetical protein RI129_008009 [Pyrocoelia pectoralis]|uniref:Uncharacterized protein n=1 Tax=Pyrocoelia pectoralis TaxID=417401 RepID=A0AAN7VIN3_9COLE
MLDEITLTIYISIKMLITEINLFLQQVSDESDGCGGKFSCIIVSEKFVGKPLLARHRFVFPFVNL